MQTRRILALGQKGAKKFLEHYGEQLVSARYRYDELRRERGAGCLAFCLDNVGKQFGRHVTNAPPGLSWRQWGESMDCFWVVEDEAEWSTTRLVNGLNGYQVYAEEARELGLTPGRMFKQLKDFPHAQFRPASSQLIVLPHQRINHMMQERFDNLA